MEKTEVKDGITIEADFIRETPKSVYLDCEGDLEWFPKSQIHFNREKKEATVPKWILQQKFPNENY